MTEAFSAFIINPRFFDIAPRRIWRYLLVCARDTLSGRIAVNTPLLQVEHLEVALAQTSRVLLHDVSFSLAPHRCLGVIGESGSGKSLLCRALLGLLNNTFVCRGVMRFAQDAPLGLNDTALRRYRGRDISLIPQHPMTAFDPLQPIGKQMVETLRAHQALRPREAKEKAIALLQQVRLENAAKRFDDYPAQLSGGMLQRVTIAIALGLAPRLLIADEPTSALDAVMQAEIVQLFAELRSRNAMTLLFVSHDLGAIQRLADSVMVMHQGTLVEQGEAQAVLNAPRHAHTRYLIDARQAMLRRHAHWASPVTVQEACA